MREEQPKIDVPLAKLLPTIKRLLSAARHDHLTARETEAAMVAMLIIHAGATKRDKETFLTALTEQLRDNWDPITATFREVI